MYAPPDMQTHMLRKVTGTSRYAAPPLIMAYLKGFDAGLSWKGVE